MGKLTKALALAALVLAVSPTGGSAASPARVRILGVVPHARPGFAAPALSRAIGFAAPSFLTFDASYENLINRYFTDVAHDSGGSSNVYSVATQYGDGTGSVQYHSTFAGSYVAKDPLPASGCDDTDVIFGVSDPVCLTDGQLQAEIQNVLTAKGWHGSPSAMYFLMTPNGVGSCFLPGDVNVPNQACSSDAFCAYHSYFTDTNSENVIYANEPYEGPSIGCSDTTDGQGFPNDTDADTTINTISHEHNEAITDPLTDPSNQAWISVLGDENGDLCAYGFGTQAGGTPGVDAYNQTINGHHYELQQEYSNADNGCVQKYPGGSPTSPTTLPVNGDNGPLVYNGGPVMHTNTTYAIYWLPTAGSTSPPVVTGTAAVNQTLASSHGSWNGAPTSYSYQWQRCSATGSACVNIAGATASTYKLTAADGSHTVRSTVRATNVNGASLAAPSATSALVVPIPAATAAPSLSGVAAVHKQLTTTSGTWNSTVTFAYRWLRCAADGSSCAAIPGATSATYVLASADIGHTFESSVSATNAAGTTVALSNRSGVVIDVPAVTKAPHISGHARVGKKLSGSHGSWTYAPTGYRYQWLRCNAHGASCSSIHHATRPTYKLTKHDAGHRLRLRITATNAAGSTMAVSAATARVGH